MKAKVMGEPFVNHEERDKQFIELRSLVINRFDALEARMDRQDDDLKEIDEKAGKAHDRAARLEGALNEVKSRVEGVARNMHDLSNKIMGEFTRPTEPRQTAPIDLNNQNVTVASLKWYAIMLATGFGAGIALLKLVEYALKNLISVMKP